MIPEDNRDFRNAEVAPAAPPADPPALEGVAKRVRAEVLRDCDALARAQAEVRRLEPLVDQRLTAYKAFLKAWRDLHNLALLPRCPDSLTLFKADEEIPF